MNLDALSLFRLAALAEALSWSGLLVGMFFKHVTHSSELGVQVFGPVHGVVFLLYVVAVVHAADELRWPHRFTAFALVAGVPPLATLLAERAVSSPTRTAQA